MGKNIKIITPKRKNEKNQNTYKENKLLKERHHVENTFAIIKKNNRIMIRKDKKLNIYMSFFYLTLLETHFMYALRKNLEKYI